MIFFTTFAPSNNNPLVRLAQKRWEGRTRSVPGRITIYALNGIYTFFDKKVLYRKQRNTQNTYKQ